ncbi:Small RNA 2'-O-methyltransferase [Acorus calamus]|uniref:Small RNA 2'-O-methyltransferase n=1 Tax=Acorus calamus TaxID=4465 RepID=A0AAV9E6U2_ACOCL|nr:Small RNA 2'-O-methyltransferase [Acorus calamus]
MSTLAVGKPVLTPKALLHQKYGRKACYRIEEVHEPVENSCPGLALPQHVRCRYRCYLELPELSIVSDAFTRKKDAEQAAAQMAIEKLGIQAKADNLTPEEAWDELVARVSYLFSEEFLSSAHPLVGHIKEASQREGGLVPLSIIAACDVKVNNLCKLIDPKAELDTLSVVILILKAAKQCGSVCISGDLWIRKRNPYAPAIIQSFGNHLSEPTECVQVEAIHVPCSAEKSVGTLSIDIVPNKYYMDEIAQSLGVCDSSVVLISRSIGKASSEMRIYFSALEVPLLAPNPSLEFLSSVEHVKQIFNERASFLSGQNIYGDAILATVGYTWRSPDLSHEDVSLGTYYRMLLHRLPDGCYKLSREAILAAELPIAFTTRSNWRGLCPKELLCMFCRQHKLLEPTFSVKSLPDIVTSPDHKPMALKLCDKVKALKSINEDEFGWDGVPDSVDEHSGEASNFICEIQILSRGNDVLLEYVPEESYRKENDAIQNASLKVLIWFNKYLKQSAAPMEILSSVGDVQGIHVHRQNLDREFLLCLSIHSVEKSIALRKCSLQDQIIHGDYYIECLDSGLSPSQGSLACISYAVALVMDGKGMNELIERKDEFEFEVGTGAVIPQLETCVMQLSINQEARFAVALPSRDLILAAAGASAKYFAQLLSSDSFHEKSCYLEYSIKLLGVTEPFEDRMEQALFSPSLSKQRVEYALRHIRESCAKTLVDFGCGSGSLLESLLEHKTTLQKIVGVDLSKKSLSRAAKMVHSKLSMNSNHGIQNASVKSAELYYGSITDFDPRLYAFDIGTCLEVIEHMEEDQAHMFGDVALGYFCPHTLIVSTPNYEYNPILQKTSSPDKDDSMDEKSQTSQCRFRNHDHKFEWTREQFEHWASNLAARHNYGVEFGGVGGSEGVEPGFASQIAIFRRDALHQVKQCIMNWESKQVYEVVWEWTDCSRSAAA